MDNAIWIFLGLVLAWILFQAVRAMREGKRERRRLEALLERVTNSACPLCGRPFGNSVREGIQLSVFREYQLPPTLARLEHLCTWQITCPNCQRSAVLAENENVFEILAAQLTEPKRLSPAYLTLVVALSLAVLGVSVYSIVRFLMR